ncbi:hypothetical protein SAMN05421739_104363 [Pontibacter chinhatensis]|uniref:Uncharacterized protein n=1 Tax=Pontibacter chinhatensis TaxID=1436961 RepID=A0A1I2VVY1_9BACT|nr:hypothetical protein SAMN05421739_104363 [Pontibacter chinhatensis]
MKPLLDIFELLLFAAQENLYGWYLLLVLLILAIL